jgi:DNA repair exonuclease SbcCD nuclease subunit
MKAAQAGARAADVRQARFVSLHEIARVAKAEHVDFVVVAGDVFEDHDVDDLVVKKCVDALERFAPIPVFMLPGNHDPLSAGGVWQRSSWRQAGAHVKILQDNNEIPVNSDVVLLPAPLTQKFGRADPTANIPRRSSDDRRIRIGIAHGALDILPERELNFPISAKRPEEAGLDYLALGDWHGTLHHGRCHYSGAHEQTKFGESDPGNILIVEIASAGEQPRVRSVRVGHLRWTEHKILLSDISDVTKLEAEIRASGPLETRLVRVRPDCLVGVSADAIERLETVRSQILEEILYADWPELVPATPVGPGDLPGGLMSDANIVLETILDGRIPDQAGRDLAGRDKATVLEARQLLHHLGGKAS